MNREAKIKAARVKVDLTQIEISEKMKIGVASYRAKENGEREFKESEINDFLDITGESYNNIFKEVK